MFTSIDKALVALVMAVLYLISVFTGITFGLSEQTVATIITLVTPILVYFFPNKGFVNTNTTVK